MRFFETILSSAAFAAAVAALEINNFPAEGVVAGETYTITYSPADDTPTTFILRQGESTNLRTLDTLTSTATGGSFEWTPSETLANHDDYALEVQQGDVINYSAQFPLTGGSDVDDYPVSSAIASAVSSAMYSASMATASAASSASAALSSAIESAKSSAISSAMSTAMTSHAASATISPSAGLNSTITSATLSHSATSTKSASVPEVTANAANSLVGSPLAGLFAAAAAFAYLA